ncbi:hypothetical protein FISHEDRAFT_24062, partial [Fistulina hepatica ATCC 64428]
LDGNVTIQLGNTLFKLHRSRLVMNSAWFASYFEDENTKQRQIHCIKMKGARAKDFEVLLDMMDDAIDYIYEPPPFSIVAAVLRAASTLSFDKYAAFAEKATTRMWPAALEELTPERIPHAAETVFLLRAHPITDCHAVLKRALYELVRAPNFGQGIDGLSIGMHDFMRIVMAHGQLSQLWRENAVAASNMFVCPQAAGDEGGGTEAAVSCVTRDPAKYAEVHTRLVHQSGVYEEYNSDVLCGLQALVDASWKAEGFCDACVDLRRRAWS